MQNCLRDHVIGKLLRTVDGILHLYQKYP